MGNNRQMLNDIRDSLSHLRKNQLESDGEGGGSAVGGVLSKSDLSQSTPSLDKSGTGAPKKGLENHTKTLAEIREALNPFKAQPKPKGEPPSASSDGDTIRSKVQHIVSVMGVDDVSYEFCLCYLLVIV
jgi:hypothetical protein